MRRPVWVSAAVCCGLVAAVAARQEALRHGRGEQEAERLTSAEGLRQVEEAARKIEAGENAALVEMRSGMASMDRYQRNKLLGRLLLHDRNLSVNRNSACVLCHAADAGYTGPSPAVNSTTVAYPGSVRTRHGRRRPQSYNYAPFAPMLHYNSLTGDFLGGNFWDMRATGLNLANPAASQAQGPPIDPDEMGFRDPACVVYRMSERPYRPLFESVWGAGALNFRWPKNAAAVCDTVWNGQGKHCDQDPRASSCLSLRAEERAAIMRAYDEFGLSIAVNEASEEASPFTSKFDHFKAGAAQLSPEEQAGMELFNGKARCHECHISSGTQPLFTDFTADNLGVPANLDISPGSHQPDLGVGAFLADRSANPNYAQWSKYAPAYMGKFQAPTLRNVDMRPYPEFVKAYMHNGYFKSLKEVVHFYNTRDALPRCRQGDPGEKVSCWPAPDVEENVNKTQLGRLGLTEAQEDQVVAFLKTLTDGSK